MVSAASIYCVANSLYGIARINPLEILRMWSLKWLLWREFKKTKMFLVLNQRV